MNPSCMTGEEREQNSNPVPKRIKKIKKQKDAFNNAMWGAH